MRRNEVPSLFQRAGACMEGHFIPTSGQRNPAYLQKAHVIIVEDIVTTGLYERKTVTSLKALGAEVVDVACLIDRSAGEAGTSIPLVAPKEYKGPVHEPDTLPPALAALPAVEPGSRGLN